MSGILRMSFRPSLVLRGNKKLIHSTEALNIAKSNACCKAETKTNPFSVAGVFKHYELLPLVGIIVAGMAGLGVYIGYYCNSRTDVQFRKRAPFESMDLQKPPVLKMVATKDYQEYKPLSELDNVLKEMAEAEELKKTEESE